MKRAVITGMGAVTPIGIGVEAFAAALEDGKCGVDLIKAFDPTAFPTRIAAEVKDFDPLQFIKKKKALKLMGKNIQYSMAAASMAVTDSGLMDAGIPCDQIGVIMGASIVNSNIDDLASAVLKSLDENGNFDLKLFGERGKNELFPLSLLRHLPNMVSCHISIEYNCQGINNTITTACASGAQAIGEAYRAICRGDARAILCGATDSRIDPLGMVSYSLLGALSTRNDDPRHASRPFERDRDGFVVGEGAGVLVLEELESARKRGAKIYAEVIGYGSAGDCFRVTDPHEDGRGSALAMQKALTDAKIDAQDVGYIAAHGTSTNLNDRMETKAIKTAYGHHAKKVPVSSIKASIGHLGAACGAIGTVATASALTRGVLPPTLNYVNPDPECDLDYIPNECRKSAAKVAMVNAFGFGGQNAALVLRKYSN